MVILYEKLINHFHAIGEYKEREPAKLRKRQLELQTKREYKIVPLGEDVNGEY